MGKITFSKKIVVSGFGAIGKRHVKNILDLGLIPYILTDYPDRDTGVCFISRRSALKGVNGIKHAVICSPTGRHLEDVDRLSDIGIRNFLVEKPLERSVKRAMDILHLAKKKKLKIYVAYNMRYLRSFGIIREFIRRNLSSIRIVTITAGYYLPEWKPGIDYTKSYNATRGHGGGVDLDLSHEIDYVLWLFGGNFKKKIIYRDKISNLKINCPDITKLILDYNTFIVDITLDYIRKPKERFLKVICENGEKLFCDFTKALLKVNGRTISESNDMDKSYSRMLEAFVDDRQANKEPLCSIKEALTVLKILEV